MPLRMYFTMHTAQVPYICYSFWYSKKLCILK